MAYSNYPKSARNNAKRALKYAEENGWGSCGTPVGKKRAADLARGAALSAKTVKRVYSFLSRHAQHADVAYGEGCGGLMYDAWGGKSMLPWAKRTVENMDKKTPRNFDPMNQNDPMTEDQLRQLYGEGVETRTVEVRAAQTEDNKMVLEGYAANFETETDLGFFKEKIARGAFDGRTEDDVRYLLNHKGMPMARTTNGTLQLEVREDGLWTRAELNDTQQSRDVFAAVKRGDISSMSFAFTIDEDEIDTDKNLRTVTRVKKVYDVSPVSFPAYPTTTIHARSAFEAGQMPDDKPTEPVLEEREEAPKTEEKTTNPERRNFTGKSQKTMNINDLKGQRAAYYEEFVALRENADAEGRAMTEAEQERADKLDTYIIDIDAKIKHRKREQEMIARTANVSGAASTSEKEAIKAVNYKFSLSRAIDMVQNQRNLEGAEAEWFQEAHKEMRQQGISPSGHVAIPQIAMRAGAADNFQATATGDGSGFVATNVPGAIEALRAPSVIQTLGAVTVNANGNLKFPRVSNGAGVTVATEVATGADAGIELDEVTLSPTRVSAKTVYSKQLVVQGGAEIDNLLARDISAAMTTQIDSAAFAKILADASVDDQTTSGTGTGDATSMTAALALSQEAAILAAGGDLAGAAYVMSPTSYKLAKQVARVANVNPLFSDAGQFNGYRAVATKHLADSGTYGQLIYGNFAQGLILAFFSGIDIMVDPFTAAEAAQVKLHVNRFYDCAIRQPGAFSICTDVEA